MSRCGLACRRDLEDFLLGSCACRKDRLNHEVSFCDGSCLIHDNRFYSFQVFKCDSAFKEDSLLGTCAIPEKNASGTLKTRAHGQLITRKVRAV